MRNLAEGYVGQDKIVQGHQKDNAWKRIVTAYKKGAIYQAQVSAVDRKLSSIPPAIPGSGQAAEAESDVTEDSSALVEAEADTLEAESDVAGDSSALVEAEADTPAIDQDDEAKKPRKTRKTKKVDEVLAEEVREAPRVEGPSLVLWIGRVKGVIPYEHSSLASPEDARDIVGQIVAFIVTGLDESRKTFTASRRDALERMAATTWNSVEPGQVRTACVRAVTRYRAIVDIGGVTCAIPAKEVSYYWVDDVRDHLCVQDVLDIKVLDVDRENRRIVVSLRAIQPDPWQDDPEKLPCVDQRVLGTIAAVGANANGDRITLRINVDPGFVCFSSVRKDGYVRHAKGDRVLVRLREVDPVKKLILASVIEQRNRSYGSVV